MTSRSQLQGRQYYKKLIDNDSTNYNNEDRDESFEATITGRKEFFLSLQSIDFHYCDKQQIVNNYNDTFRQLVLVELLAEITTISSSQLSAKISQILGVNVDKEAILKWVASNKIPNITPKEMLRKYQVKIIEEERVGIGLEVLDKALMDFTDLEDFDSEVEHLRKDYNLTLQQDEIEKNKELLRKKAVQRVIQRLSYIPHNAQGSSNEVLIFAKFEIHEHQDHYMLIHPHPVKKYYGEDIRISVRVKKDDIIEDCRPEYADQIGGKGTIPLKIYGSIFNPIDPDNDSWNFIVRPFAIYQ